jgi:hypothetical protein
MPPSKIVQRQPRVDLPPWLAEGIGQIASEWSHLEWQLEDAIRVLLQTDVKRARIVTTGMNIRTRGTCLVSLMQAMNVSETLITAVAAINKCISDQLESERNKIVHGLWAKAGNEWRLLIRTGARKQPIPGRKGKFRRSVLPEEEIVTPTSLSAIRKRIKEKRLQMKVVRQQLEAALAP